MPTPIFNSLAKLRLDDTKVPAVTSLHDALASLSRNIIAFEPHERMRLESNPSWLYIRQEHQIDVRRLKAVIQAWLNCCYPAQAAEIIKGWETIDWNWQPIDLQTAAWQLKRMLLPGLITRWLVENGYQLALEGAASHIELSMRLVPLMSVRYIAELLSEPQDDYSFALRFWLDIFPGTNTLCLFQRASVRRWSSQPLATDKAVYLAADRRKSVFLRVYSGYLEGIESEPVFSRITLKKLGKDAQSLRWVGYQSDLFRVLDQRGDFPTAEQLARNPQKYSSNMQIAIDNNWPHKVKAGMWPKDHRLIFEGLNQKLATWATPIPRWERQTIADRDSGRDKTLSQRGWRTATLEQRKAALMAMALPARLELYVDNPATIKKIILERIGLAEQYGSKISENPLVLEVNGRSILEIEAVLLPQLTALLPDSAYRNPTEATEQRRQEISKMRHQATIPTGALIQLQNYSDTREQKRDPKNAIRFGLADSKRTSQFFTPRRDDEEQDQYMHRCESTVLDLLHGLGYRLNPLYVKPKDSPLPDQLDLVGLWLFQLNARHKHRDEQTIYLPLMVEAQAGTQHIRVFLPDSTGGAKLYSSMREALLAASSYDLDYSVDGQIVGFFRRALQKRDLKRDTLLLVVDQNLRRIFHELGEQSSITALLLNNILPKEPSSIRVARLRFSNHDEAAFCSPTSQRSKYNGLYHHSRYPNLFYSLHDVGDRHVPSNKSKLDNPKTACVNPSTVQIMLTNLQPEDNPAAYAGLIHNLREESSHTENATLLPQPLHDILEISKYVSRFVEDSKLQEGETEQDDDINGLEPL